LNRIRNGRTRLRLLGAADADGDGEVVLDELYRYAYGASVCATSRITEAQTHFLRIVDGDTLEAPLVVGFAVRRGLAVGKHF